MSHFVVVCLVEPDVWERGPEAVQTRIDEIMAPYDERKRVEPSKRYLSAQDVARMAEYYKADPAHPAVLVPYLENWSGYRGDYDEQGLYYLSDYNPQSKWDWYTIGGRWDGDMPGLAPLDDPDGGFAFGDQFHSLERNACPVQALGTEFVPYAVVSARGWLGKGEMGWFGISQGDDEDAVWKGKYTEFLSAHPGHIAVSLDVHI